MAVANRAPQPELELRTPEEIAKDLEAESDRLAEERTSLINACKSVARQLGWEYCSNELERRWGRHGLHVTEGLLRACCNTEAELTRNYFRLEWAEWFAGHSEIVAAILRTWGRTSTKSVAQELADLKLTIAEEHPRQAEKYFDKARKR